MTCSANVYSDGSWQCPDCMIGGDRDEPLEEFCPVLRAEQESDEDLEERLNAHAKANRDRAHR